MKILVINAGSSSLKYQLVEMSNESVIAKGLCERIGLDGRIVHQIGGEKIKYDVPFPSHQQAFEELVKLLTTGDKAVISDMSEIAAVGHRVVQGGDRFSDSALITEEMLSVLESITDLAPLHNPANIMAIRACMKVFSKGVPQVAVFDTSFHSSIPEKAFIYPIPYEMYEKHRIRRYGFHGTSHRYVSARVAELMGKPLSQLKVITCHLGNGSSVAAVDCGKSVDTTMGLTPLEGLGMGTRCGSIDPSIVTFLMDKEGLDTKGINDLMNKKSGYLGVSGLTNDMRDLEEAAEKGHARAALTLDILGYQLLKYIGGFAAAMGGVDAVVFTGGIGENSDIIRAKACEGLGFIGLTVDEKINNGLRSKEVDITTKDSKVKAWVVPTNEELVIARDTKEVAKLK
ncbi:MAG: acetate kinase [Oscillospiraceae bacterium]|nr:acetate kinase [Oscillospiraceae bacterium]